MSTLLHPDRVFVVAEIGPNHNGSLDIAKKLIDVAVYAGCDAVKFQKKTPAISLPPDLWFVKRDTPFGYMEYLEYRKLIEFGESGYDEIDKYCGRKGILWFASPWDLPSANFLLRYDLPIVKVASASLTNFELLDMLAKNFKRFIVSTGMSTERQVLHAISYFMDTGKETAILACRSDYPVKVEDLNLKKIETLRIMFPWAVVGYSGHEIGLWTTLLAVGMGARVIERHITLDRAMKGSDHAASIEPQGLKMLVREIRNFELALGDGSFSLTEGEMGQIKRLRLQK